MSGQFPELAAVVLDATNARETAEFYRQLLGLRYRPGDEAPPPDGPDPQADWLVLVDDGGRARLAVQRVDELPRPTWPEPPVPQQLHLDLAVPTVDDLRFQRARAVALGATVLEDRTDDPAESIVVFADPAGHPFCILVGPTTVAT